MLSEKRSHSPVLLGPTSQFSFKALLVFSPPTLYLSSYSCVRKKTPLGFKFGYQVTLSVLLVARREGKVEKGFCIDMDDFMAEK